tara:strand:- start:601 stop:951 length:351 start_codon:yes stop_codon:yes gene_type:complete
MAAKPEKTADENAADADAEAMTAEAVTEAEAAAMDGEAAPATSKRKGRQVATGPTTGYRDAPKDIGGIVTADFLDGFLPAGWEDTPAKCKNYSGKGHDPYTKVVQHGGKWVPVRTD